MRILAAAMCIFFLYCNIQPVDPIDSRAYYVGVWKTTKISSGISVNYGYTLTLKNDTTWSLVRDCAHDTTIFCEPDAFNGTYAKLSSTMLKFYWKDTVSSSIIYDETSYYTFTANSSELYFRFDYGTDFLEGEGPLTFIRQQY